MLKSPRLNATSPICTYVHTKTFHLSDLSDNNVGIAFAVVPNSIYYGLALCFLNLSMGIIIIMGMVYNTQPYTRSK